MSDRPGQGEVGAAYQDILLFLEYECAEYRVMKKRDTDPMNDEVDTAVGADVSSVLDGAPGESCGCKGRWL